MHPMQLDLNSGVPEFMLETVARIIFHVLRGREESTKDLNKRKCFLLLGQLSGVCQIQPAACFCTIHDLRMLFAYLKGCKKKRKICHGNHMWSTKAKVFTIWYFMKKGC